MTTRTRGVAVGVAALAATAMVFGSGAAAANPDTPATSLSAEEQVGQSTRGQDVVEALGEQSGGVYLDDTGHAVVTVLSDEAVQQVRQAGLATQKVKYSYANLLQTKQALDQVRDVPQTSWGIDPSSNKVVVTILDSATPATAAKVTEAAGGFGDKVTVKHEAGRNEFYIAGGDGITNGNNRCSLGFNVNRDGENFMLTAGHCTNLGGTWSGEDVSGGEIVESDCPGPDAGLISNPNGSSASEINDGTAITSAAEPTVGQEVKKSGDTTGYTEGEVTGIDETVNFDVGVLEHMTGTTVDSDKGDSGGPGYTGSAGQGTLSGGNDTTTYFYPLHLELEMYGVSLN